MLSRKRENCMDTIQPHNAIRKAGENRGILKQMSLLRRISRPWRTLRLPEGGKEN